MVRAAPAARRRWWWHCRRGGEGSAQLRGEDERAVSGCDGLDSRLSQRLGEGGGGVRPRGGEQEWGYRRAAEIWDGEEGGAVSRVEGSMLLREDEGRAVGVVKLCAADKGGAVGGGGWGSMRLEVGMRVGLVAVSK